MSTRGHLFVVQADLTRLAADAFLIPCDNRPNVSGTWRPFIEPGAATQAKQDWFTPSGVRLDNGIAVLPDLTPKNPTPDQVVGLRVLVDTVGVDSIAAMVGAIAASRPSRRRPGDRARRTLPCRWSPCPYSAWAKASSRAGGPRLFGRWSADSSTSSPPTRSLSPSPCNAKLTIAAAQWERHRRNRDLEADCWTELTAEQIELADRLGEKAARGELSVFAGAGVSKPVGFPDWKGLLQDLAGDKTLVFTQETDYAQVAEDLNRPDLNEEVARRLSTSKHALGHALLVDLRTPSLVTTNYDPCLENAATVIHHEQPLRVLARQLAAGGSPWLLKSHGDVAHPKTIVLTRAHYHALETDLPALRGMVQTLMLTSHLLFVGFGFADDDFLAMSQATQKVRDLATDQPADAKAGTAIGLCPSEGRTYAELDYHYLRTDGGLTGAARQLEILLDRLVWRSQISGRGRARLPPRPRLPTGRHRPGPGPRPRPHSTYADPSRLEQQCRRPSRPPPDERTRLEALTRVFDQDGRWIERADGPTRRAGRHATRWRR